MAVRHDSKIKPPVPSRDGFRHWLSGLAVMVATAVSFVGFAHISIGWTLAISSLILVGLIIFLWIAGGK